MTRSFSPASLSGGDLRSRARAAEREAQLAARSAVRSESPVAIQSHLPTPTNASQTDPSLEAALPGTGRALTRAERDGFETALGHDFSGVRVHTGPDAAQAADEASANAFTRGNHVVLGSGQLNSAAPAARELVTHELAHTAQQERAGAAGATQRQPKDPSAQQRRLGANPPDEPVAIAKGIAQEDTFVLFEQDQAAVSPDSEKKLTTLAKQYQKPVVVEIHGYASTEGDADYNSNLSGHRAVRIKRYLLSALPAGSEVRLFAHGETAAFGAAPSNRRGAVHVVPGATPTPAPSGAKPEEKAEAWHAPIFVKPDAPLADPLGVLQPAGKTPFLVPQLKLDPGLYTSPGSLLPTLPPLKDPTIDWRAMREPFVSRGLRLGDGDLSAIEKNWTYSYNFFIRLGLPPNVAAWGANHGTAYAYDKQLSLEAPNQADRFDAEFERAKAQVGVKEFKTPIVPIITPDTLKWVSKQLFNKDLSFEF